MLLGYDGTFNIEIGKKYKVFKKDEYTDTYGFTFDIYFNGTAGDLNHVDIKAPEWDPCTGPNQAAHMGRSILHVRSERSRFVQGFCHLRKALPRGN